MENTLRARTVHRRRLKGEREIMSASVSLRTKPTMQKKKSELLAYIRLFWKQVSTGFLALRLDRCRSGRLDQRLCLLVRSPPLTLPPLIPRPSLSLAPVCSAAGPWHRLPPLPAPRPSVRRRPPAQRHPPVCL